MSIEQALKDLTAAITENTSRLDAMLKGAKPAADSKPAAAGKPAAADKPKATTRAKKGPTVEDIADLAGKLMSVEDADDRKANKAAMAKILAKFETERLTKVDPEHIPAVVDALKRIAEGEEPFEDEDGGGEEEDDDDMV